ncbi:MAG TPA: hypothetical protein VMK13_07325 [Streptosporangiaceae bacterium]|nr:hypothetical protein [Streptosporangiaceae bacterium]
MLNQPFIRSRACLVGCAGDGRVGLAAADDVARAAAIVLTERDAHGANYELIGPEALSMAEMTAVLSEVLGRTITYQDMPEAEFRTRAVELGMPEDQVNVRVMLHQAAWERGDAALVTDTYRELTGKTPTSLKEWVAAHQDAFAPGARLPGPFSSRPLSRSRVRGRATCPGVPPRSQPSRPVPARSPHS